MKKIIEYNLVRKIRDTARIFGYKRNFEIDGIKYKVDTASVGKTPLGYPAALDIEIFIKERNLQKLHILDIACGAGIIGLTVFKRMINTPYVDKVSFSDINFFNLNTIDRILKINNLIKYKNDKIKIYLSDNLEGIPNIEKFDIVVSNPPDFYIENLSEIDLTGKTLGRYSSKNEFHYKFYNSCHNFLNSGGQVWFIENEGAISKEKVQQIIVGNPNLKFIGFLESPTLKTKRQDIYWSICKKK